MPTTLAKAAIVAVIAPFALSAASGRSLQIEGKAGYLSEWEVAGDAAADPTSADTMRGRISWKHVGLCAVSGPVEKSGDISFRISGWGPFARLDATMSFEQSQCTYSGSFSGQTKGTMDCTDAKGIPLTLSIK